MTSSPQPEDAPFNPQVGIGMPAIFERGLGRDRVAEGDYFLRIGCGKLIKNTTDWAQSSAHVNEAFQAVQFQAVQWHEQLIDDYQCLRQQTQQELQLTNGRRIGYRLAITTQLITSKTELGFDQHWSLTVIAPWSEPIVFFPIHLLDMVTQDQRSAGVLIRPTRPLTFREMDILTRIV